MCPFWAWAAAFLFLSFLSVWVCPEVTGGSCARTAGIKINAAAIPKHIRRLYGLMKTPLPNLVDADFSLTGQVRQQGIPPNSDRLPALDSAVYRRVAQLGTVCGRSVTG